MGTMTATGMRIERQAAALGAIVTGVDLATDVDDETFASLHDALLEHLVICIRDGSGPMSSARTIGVNFRVSSITAARPCTP